jgi:hypothetical protein
MARRAAREAKAARSASESSSKGSAFSASVTTRTAASAMPRSRAAAKSAAVCMSAASPVGVRWPGERWRTSRLATLAGRADSPSSERSRRANCSSGKAAAPAPRPSTDQGRASRTSTRSPGRRSPANEVQVPTLKPRLTPSSARSLNTKAALGPPIPVDCTVRPRPPAVSPEYPHSPRAWLLIFGCSVKAWASAIARPGSPTRIASGWISAVGRSRLGTAATLNAPARTSLNPWPTSGSA